MPSYQVKQSSTAYPLVFLLVQSSDHITGLTGATPTVTISKAGGAFAAPSGAVAEIGSGWYKVAGNATDTATLGPLALHATATSGDPCDALYEVVAHDVQDALRLGLSSLPSASPAASGGLPTVGTGAGQVNPDGSGSVPVAFGTTLPASPAANTVGEALKFADTRLDAAVSTRSTFAGGAVASVTAGVTLAAAGLDSITVETGLNGRQALAEILAACAGVLSGAGTGTITIKNPAGATTRITATTDSSGNRSAIALNPPA
jgi:hypothetical protein